MFTTTQWKELQKANSSQVVAIDFDGVIHKNSKGYNDGSIYDEPVMDSIESIKKLSEYFKIVIYTFKGHPDRPKVNGKDGIELVWDWLRKYDLQDHIEDIVWGKPNAIIYIDDKGYKFENWNDTFKYMIQNYINE